jgi:hypothetical protein
LGKSQSTNGDDAFALLTKAMRAIHGVRLAFQNSHTARSVEFAQKLGIYGRVALRGNLKTRPEYKSLTIYQSPWYIAYSTGKKSLHDCILAKPRARERALENECRHDRVVASRSFGESDMSNVRVCVYFTRCAPWKREKEEER